ncbi:hypothetical protein [Arcanobacterium phocae]|uniref:hypothetical protein n=1 Tax=Arcanobacterium phocae TaxID=131112 RepID=UPI001C0EDA34|nr:hypothetical protein [Arcanobacterium phocae]
MKTQLLKSMLPGLVSYAASGSFEVLDSPAYLRLIDQRNKSYGDEYLVDYRGRQLSNQREAETPQVSISARAVEKLLVRCDNPGENESPLIPAIGHVWVPVDRSFVGFCLVPLEAYDPEAEYFGRGKALNITLSSGYILNTDYLGGFIGGAYPCLAAGKMSLDSFLGK